MKVLTIILLLFSFVRTNAQGRYDADWFFGDSAAVMFMDTGVAVINTSKKVGMYES